MQKYFALQIRLNFRSLTGWLLAILAPRVAYTNYFVAAVLDACVSFSNPLAARTSCVASHFVCSLAPKKTPLLKQNVTL
jgi:hypothetical protein